MSCHVYYNAGMCVYGGNLSRGLLLGITFTLGLSSLPHHLTKVIGFSTVL